MKSLLSSDRRMHVSGRSYFRRLIPSMVGALCAMVVVGLVLTGAVASASTIHPFLGSFDIGGPNGSPFGSVSGIAVDESTGDVYVYDYGTESIYKFDSSGVPAEFAGLKADAIALDSEGSGGAEQELAVDNSGGPDKGDIYLSGGIEGWVKIFGSNGLPLGELNSGVQSAKPGAPWARFACGVAVDHTGNVYVGLNEEGPASAHVNEYTPAGGVVSNSDYTASLWNVDEVCNVAVDSEGSVYTDTFNGDITKFAASQFFPVGFEMTAIPTLTDPGGVLNLLTLAVDPSMSPNDDLYVNQGDSVAQYDSSGEPLDTFADSGMSAISESHGIAVNGSTKKIYISNATKNGEIDIFSNGPVPPTIEEASISEVASTSATLNAALEPGGEDTAYHFEYGTTTSYGTIVPVPDGDAGSDEHGTFIVPPVHLQGLQPDTKYHYRLVARSALGIRESADRAFTTQALAQPFVLPDGRQYELVSPANKYGTEPIGFHQGVPGPDIVQSAEDGNSITYLTPEPFLPDAPANANGTQVYSTRSVGGWSSQDIATPNNENTGLLASEGHEYRAFSSDLSLGIVEPETARPLIEEAPTQPYTPYIHNNLDGEYKPLVTTGEKLGKLDFIVAAPDILNGVILGDGGLTDEPSNEHVYEWVDGALKPVNVLPNGELGRGAPGGKTDQRPIFGAVSSDGSHVIWSDNDNDSLYDRDMVTGKTVQVGSEGANYVTASADGSKIVFTNQSIAPEGSAELDVFEVGSEKLVTLGSRVLGVLGASEDASYVYFVSKSVLAAGAQKGVRNLYVSHDVGGSWISTFIATLSQEDETDWYENFADVKTSRVSPNGRFLAFMSVASLTGYDNKDATTGQRDSEVYLFDVETGGLTCASCNSTGARPVGSSVVRAWTPYRVSLSTYQSRYLSDTGRLFFDSNDVLVPQYINGHQDVYEFEPEGVGSCEVNGGCVSLISSGTGSDDSEFLDASASGDDVFFRTRSQLVPEDFDHVYDVYDAHMCSVSVPCRPLPPVVPPPCSSGDGCKSAPSPQPAIYGAPASATFSGAGNVVGGGMVSGKVKAKPKAKKPKAKKPAAKRHVRRVKLGRVRRSRVHAGLSDRAKR